MFTIKYKNYFIQCYVNKDECFVPMLDGNYHFKSIRAAKCAITRRG